MIHDRSSVPGLRMSLLPVLFLVSGLARAADPGLADLTIPGPDRFVTLARDVLEVRLALNPDAAANAGLYADATQVPSFAPATVTSLERRLRKDLAGLSRLKWDTLTVDEQIDVRWTVALAEEAHHRLTVEQSWTHRPGEWLEPLSNSWIALAGQVPDRLDLQRALAARVPAMLDEVRRYVVAPTAQDIETTRGLVEGLLVLVDLLPPGPEAEAARMALQGYRDELPTSGLPEFRVVGAESYAWRLEHAMLSPWTPDTLLERATRDLAAVDARLAALGLAGDLPSPTDPTPEEQALADGLDRQGLLGLYDQVVTDDLAALRTMGVITIPADLPPLRARETPDAMVPLTGDGGSMNPPPLFGTETTGWWNVEHFQAAWTPEERLLKVLGARRHHETQMGPYAVHEGVPGHHLQLSLVRANPDPIRTLFIDNAAVEGWGLYAEQLFWEGGGFGPSALAEARMLRSYRFRIRRVFYDVNVERGAWTLQQAADWRADTAPGVSEIDPEILRTIQWPTQLIGYYHGKAQILDLRDEVRQARGAAWSASAFHDELLATGPIPLVLVRAKMLGQPIPPPPSRRGGGRG